ncbi:ATP-binding protein [Paenibacillus hamazuiensis]|uniref:ATP-binding protein n=1 Tax=Paenibacillus hamazuiensis TaxID=2936508 RepID=UPI00200F4B55|nr:ATP-binding protein [Paenibacillus hamazuiensis]
MMTSENPPQKKTNEAHLSQLASVGQIAAGIAHEVKNPLTAVKGFLQLLKERNDKQYIEIAQSELDNALAILQNLLHVSKPDLENEAFESIDLTVELESLTQLFQDQFYRVAVVKDLQDPGNFILGKRNQLKKAFFNLLKNAFEAIPGKGTITITHSAGEKEITVCIQDSGIGIPRNKLEMLGTPFFTTKENGTGMGLTLVFSVIYEHNGTVKVESEEQAGTKFIITFPKGNGSIIRKEVVRMELQQAQTLKDFFTVNRDLFEKRLLAEAVNVRDKIDEILTVGNINLLENAHKLVIYIVESREHEVISFARMEGVSWAKHSLTLAFKLEWIQAVRRVMWDFLYNYDRINDSTTTKEQFYNQEKRINELMDQFIHHLFMSYTQFKDDLIRVQREMVEDLSAPIIPLTASTSILPLIGFVDTSRANTIEDKVITQIGNYRIETLIIDLSGVINMEPEVIKQLINVIDGVKMMGCHVVITGLRPDVVKTMIRSGLSFESKATTKGTLQQAIVDHIGVALS